MKRAISLFLSLAVMLTLAACSKKKPAPQEATPSAEATTAPTAAPTTETAAAAAESTAATDASTSATEATAEATAAPTEKPTTAPTTKATEKPTTAPTTQPTEKPTTAPTTQPTEKPTTVPTTKATEKPTTAPTTQPTEKPTTAPTEPPHTHTWENATCQTPKTCSGCGATEGAVGSHTFENGICTVCKAADILNPKENLLICDDNANPEYISQVYAPYSDDSIAARGVSFWNDGGYGEGIYCLMLDAVFSCNEEDVDVSRTPVAYEEKEYYRHGAGMHPAEVELTDTKILITDQWYSSTIKMVLMGNGNLKVTESTDSNYPVGMEMSIAWNYLN